MEPKDFNGAIYYKNYNKLLEVSEYSTHKKLELWSYDPIILSNSEFVDILSLFITYNNSEEYRMLQEINKKLEELPWYKDCQKFMSI